MALQTRNLDFEFETNHVPIGLEAIRMFLEFATVRVQSLMDLINNFSIRRLFDFICDTTIPTFRFLTTTMKFVENFYGHRFQTAQYCLVTEEGCNHVISYAFPDLETCKTAAKSLWVSHVIMKRGSPEVIQQGGWGFGHKVCRDVGIRLTNNMFVRLDAVLRGEFH